MCGCVCVCVCGSASDVMYSRMQLRREKRCQRGSGVRTAQYTSTGGGGGGVLMHSGAVCVRAKCTRRVALAQTTARHRQWERERCGMRQWRVGSAAGGGRRNEANTDSGTVTHRHLSSTRAVRRHRPRNDTSHTSYMSYTHAVQPPSQRLTAPLRRHPPPPTATCA